MNYIVLDFETAAIQPRPDYPPTPVSFALKMPHRPTKFYAWGHPTENNCAFEEAKIALQQALGRELPLVMHHAKFDLAVLEEKMDVRLPDACHIHDTMILAHLSNPYEPTFALKPLAEKHLQLPPTERDAVRDWLVENGVCRASAKDWGAFISFAPGKLVGDYAIGDVERTAQLFEKLYADIERRDMVEAYDRERSLIPVLMENEKRGVRVDLEALESDFVRYTEAMEKVERWIRQRLNRPEMNLDSDAQVAEALRENGVVLSFKKTRKGRDSVAKKNLRRSSYTDQDVFLALAYRNRAQTCLSTFIGPWLEMARKSGRIYTSWRQLGAQTGRMSSSPNLQNIPKDWYGKPDGYEHPEFLGVPELPLMRGYILPEEGEVLVGADFGGQELRVAAHFEQGELAKAYRENPDMDPHGFVEASLQRITPRVFKRGTRKAAMFLRLYGGGVNRLKEELDVTEAEARQLHQAITDALPGVWEMDAELKELARFNESFRTLGGREYFCEPPAYIDGRYCTFDYKMLNYLIQGSSADMTKAAMLRYDSCKQHGNLLLQVHDELVLSVPVEHAQTEAAILTNAMQTAMPLDVPLIAEAKAGPNFASLKEM